MTKKDAKPRRIALVASYAPSLTLFRGPLIREIIAQGHHVLCAAPDFDDVTEAEITEWGAETRSIPLSRTGLGPIRDWRTLRALTRLFREWRPDVVMGYTAKPAIYSALAAQRCGVGHIVPMVTGLGYAFLEGGGAKRAFIRRIMTALYARAFRASHGVIFHNNDDAQVLKDAGILPEKLSITVSRGSGVDLTHYACEPVPTLPNGVTFLMIARLVRYKGVAEYCEAAQLLRKKGLHARCLLVGPAESGPAGFPAEELESHAGVITYLGPSDDVRAHIRDAHVYVLPSYGEGMPRTVLEALALGRPVITTDTRGCRETVTEGVNGYLVPIRNASALADAMARFITRPDIIPGMAAQGRKLAEAEFDVARVNKTMLKALSLGS